MAVVYCDSSALVKRYIQETGSAWVQNLCDPVTGYEIYTIAVTEVEVTAAILRRARGKSISTTDAAAAHALFQADLAADYQVVAVTEPLIAQAVTLTQNYGLRGYDALQLAAACAVNRLGVANGLPPLLFISADTELNAAAQQEGLSVDNPNAHP